MWWSFAHGARPSAWPLQPSRFSLTKYWRKARKRMRATIERSVAADNFSMLALHDVAWARIEADSHVAPIVPDLRQRLSTHYRKLAYAVLRSAFLIELVKVPKIETTKFRVRWFEQLVDDPRGCA